MRKSKYKYEIGRASWHDFAAIVENILGAILPNITQSKHLLQLDREGVDVYQFEDETFQIGLAVQCKGYEREWHSERVEDLKGEIAKFIRKAQPVNEYWLVLNRSIPNTNDRKAIESALAGIVSAGKAKTAKLLDLDKFIKEVSSRAAEKFRQLSQTSRQALADDYRARMASVDYLPHIPFRNLDAAKTDVTSHIIQAMHSYVANAKPAHTGRYRKSPRYLITGSFGFGKTLGLHALGELWAQENHDVYFFPAANLSERAFVNSAGLLSDVMLQIVDDDLAENEMALGILQDACKHAFRTSYPLLLIDAIDESQFWNDPERLSMLWFSIEQLGIPAVVTVRDELFDSRPLDFATSDSKPFFERLQLTDWDHSLMTRFLDRFASQRDANPPDTFLAFRHVVASGRYEDHYGDIPKRPLFLSMLAEDAWQGDDPELELYRLYGKYFRTKLQRDWASVAAPGRLVRGKEIARQFGKEEAAEALIRMMQKLALVLHERKDDPSSPEASTFTEEVLRTCVTGTIGPVDQIEDVLFTSLIQPAGRDPITKHRVYRFAHQSFRDWFLARALVEQRADTNGSDLTRTVEGFATAMGQAVARGESLP
ncbi:NACHT domain-containing protein [Martelella sp. AMO21009]